MRTALTKLARFPECIPFPLNEDKDLRYNCYFLLCSWKKKEEEIETKEENGDVKTRYMFNILD